MAKCAPISASAQSSSEPASRSSDTGSTNTGAPPPSGAENTWSSAAGASSRSKPYWKPEQPPALTETRKPAPGRPSRDLDYLALVDARTFAPAGPDFTGTALLLVAARVGATRLIDNVIVGFGDSLERGN